MRHSSNVSLFAACVSVMVGVGCLAPGSIEGPGIGGGADGAATSDPSSAGDAGIQADSPSTVDARPPRDSDGATDPRDASSVPSDTGTPEAAPSGDDAAVSPPVTPDAAGTPEASVDAPVTVPPPGDSLEAARVKCVANINSYRATLGLAAYARWDTAESCVDGQAEADGKSGVAHSAFGHCSEWAQNECPGWSGPPSTIMDGCLKMMWDEGPGQPFEAHGHYINMSSTSYTKVACGFHQAADGSWWATQDFQ